MKVIKTFFVVLLFVLIAKITFAQTEDKSLLTLERIFNSNEFSSERSLQSRWIEDGKYYKNSLGLDDKILHKCLNLAKAARRLKIPVTTFMVASDPYLQEFVHDFTEANNGKAFYTSLQGLGEFVFEDFERNKKRTFRR